MKRILILLALLFSFEARAAIVPSNVTTTANTSQDVDTAKNMLWVPGDDGKLHQVHSNNTGDLFTAPAPTVTPTITPTFTTIINTLTPTLTLTPAQVINVTVTGTVTPANVLGISAVVTCAAGANTPCPTYDIPANTSYAAVIFASGDLTPCQTIVILPQASLDGVSWGTIGAGVLDFSGTLSGGAPKSIVRNEVTLNGITNVPVTVHVRMMPTMVTLGSSTSYGMSLYYQRK